MPGRCLLLGHSRCATAIARTVVFAVLSGVSGLAWASGMYFESDPKTERRGP